MKYWVLLKEIWHSQVSSYEKKSHQNMYINVMTAFFEQLPKRSLRGLWLIGTSIVTVIITSIITIVFENIFRGSNRPLNILSYVFSGVFIQYLWVYVLVWLLCFFLLFRAWQQFIYNHQSLLEGHLGTSRWTSQTEIEEQYKAIPKKAEVVYKEKSSLTDDYGNEMPEIESVSTYPGLSGVLISRSEQKQVAYIDTGPVHNVYYGRTRSGKTQAAVKANIDIYSRSQEQPHLVIASTKYELYASSVDQLTARGYEVNILNLIDLERSIGYNPLELVTEFFKNNDPGEAIEICKTFSYPLYHNKEAREPVWEDTAMALVNANILALCHEFLEKSHNEELVTLYNTGQMIVELGVDASNGLSILDNYFDHLSPSNPARTEYSTVRQATGQMRSSIFSSTQAKLRKFTAPKIAALMSKTTYDFKRFLVGYHKEVCLIRPADKPLGSQPIHIIIKDKADKTVLFEYTVVPDSKKGIKHDELRMKPVKSDDLELYFRVHDDRIVHIHFSDNEEHIEVVDKNKPQALFIVMPDYIETNSIVASTFIQQLYYVLSKHASQQVGDKLDRRVRFVLDEFANLDAFTNITSMLSVGAGRGILFDLFIQDDTQMTMRYNEDISTFVRTQGMNIFFIQSSNDEMNRKFSEVLGNKEVTLKSRSGNLFQSKSINESPTARPLMFPDELGRLKEGEVVIYRAGTRRDLKGNLIVPYPIHNDGDSRFVYEWEYMAEQFGATKAFSELPLPYTPTFDLHKYASIFSNRIKHIAPNQEMEQPKIRQSSKERKQMIDRDSILNDKDFILYQTYNPDNVLNNQQDIMPIYEEAVDLYPTNKPEPLPTGDVLIPDMIAFKGTPPGVLLERHLITLVDKYDMIILEEWSRIDNYGAFIRFMDEYSEVKEYFNTYTLPFLTKK